MSLEIDKIAPQVEDLARQIGLEKELHGKALKLARETFSRLGPEQEALKKKLETAKTTWMAAEPLGNMDSLPASLPPPKDYSAIAVDGSSMTAERYSPRSYFLINLGVSMLTYGDEPDARLFSTPRLYFKQEEIAIKDPSGKEREVLVEGVLLGVKRQVEEAAYLATLAADFETGNRPVLALLDGTLIMWGLEDQKIPAFIHHALLDEGLIKALEAVKNLSRNTQDSSVSVSLAHADGKQETEYRRQKENRPESCSTNQVAIASYISATGSNDVVKLLRIYLCPHEPVNCDRFCKEKATGERECDTLSGVSDRVLFSSLLKPGQRSSLFGSKSSIMKYYGENRVCFFYLRLEDEVARVEVPEWITKREDTLSLIHSMIYDQCLRGQGYPVALSEAHERAVLRAEDRKLFSLLLEQLCPEKDLVLALSAKDSSKRNRWI